MSIDKRYGMRLFVYNSWSKNVIKLELIVMVVPNFIHIYKACFLFSFLAQSSKFLVGIREVVLHPSTFPLLTCLSKLITTVCLHSGKSGEVMHKYGIYLRTDCILLKFHWGMKALTEVHFQWSASCWKCSLINAFIPQWNFKRMHSILIIIFKSHQNFI